MIGLTLAAAYATVGLVCGIVLKRRRGNIDDCLLLSLFWPIFAPFVLRSQTLPGDDKAGQIVAKLAVAGDLMPGEVELADLAERLRSMEEKAISIDALLATASFDREAAHQRLTQLQLNGSPMAVASAKSRLVNIEHLIRMRQKLRSDMDEVDALASQLLTQAKIVDLTGANDSMHELISDLLERIQGLDSALAEVIAT